MCPGLLDPFVEVLRFDQVSALEYVIGQLSIDGKVRKGEESDFCCPCPLFDDRGILITHLR